MWQVFHGPPRLARGELWTNHQIDNSVICLVAIGVEALELVDEQALVGPFVPVPIVAFSVVLHSGRVLNLVRGQAKQRLFVQDDPAPENTYSCATRVLPSAARRGTTKTVSSLQM